MPAAVSAIYLPTAMVMSNALPSVCPRHGRPSSARRKITFVSPAEPWTYILIIASILVMAIVQLAMQKRLKPTAFPVCRECLERRTRAHIGVVAGVAAFVLSFVVFASGRGGGAFAFGLLLLFGGPIAALVFAVLASWSHILAADVMRDGFSLRLRRPAPQFVTALPPIAPAPPPPPPVPGYGYNGWPAPTV